MNWIFTCAPGLAGQDYEVGTWLRAHMGPSDIMYSKPDQSSMYVTYTGIAQVWLGNAWALPIPDELIRARVDLMQDLPSDPEPYRRERIRYFVPDGSDGRVGKVVAAWESRGIAHERARFGSIRIVEL